MVRVFHWQYGDILLAIYFFVFTYYFVLSLKNKYTILNILFRLQFKLCQFNSGIGISTKIQFRSGIDPISGSVTLDVSVCVISDEKLKQYEKRAKRRAIRALHQAISVNRLSTVREFITPELDVNFHYNGKTALQIAVVEGFDDICKLLIENGADVNKTNAEGNCLVNMAVWHGHTSLVELLVSHDAEIDVSNNHGSTPVSTAAYCGDAIAVRTLVKAECDIDAPDKRGQSPLLIASWRGHEDVVHVLIGGGCDVNWTDYERRTALNIAAGRGHFSVVGALVDAGR